MKSTLVTSIKKQQGVAAIEFALIFMVFFAIFYGIATFSTVFYFQQAISRAAEDGARAVNFLTSKADSTQTNNIGVQQLRNIVINSLANSFITPISYSASIANRKQWITSNVPITIDTNCTVITGATQCVKITISYPYQENYLLAPLSPITDNWFPTTLIGRAVSQS